MDLSTLKARVQGAVRAQQEADRIITAANASAGTPRLTRKERRLANQQAHRAARMARNTALVEALKEGLRPAVNRHERHLLRDAMAEEFRDMVRCDHCGLYQPIDDLDVASVNSLVAGDPCLKDGCADNGGAWRFSEVGVDDFGKPFSEIVPSITCPADILRKVGVPFPE